MKSKLNLLVTILAVLVFSNLVMAQVERISIPGPIKGVPNLPCCKCLEGGNSLDLSTTPANKWTVNGSPVAFVSPVNAGWISPTGTAQWVSTVVDGSTSWTSVPAGNYEYKLQFHIPDCAIDQEVTLSGTLGGDNSVEIDLDTTSNKLAECITGNCFKAPLTTFTKAGLLPGTHFLIVKVKNSEGPSGMFVDAKLTSRCLTKLTK